MNAFRHNVRAVWWLVHHDLRREGRSLRVGPSMLLLGLVLVLLIAAQIELPAAWRRDVAGGLYWLAVFFAGTIALERSFVGEREGDGLQTLTLYPISAWTIYLSKLLVNVLAILGLQVVVAAALVIFADTPIFAHPGPLALIALLANIGYAAVGTVVGAVTSGAKRRGGLLALLVLPLVSPVVLAAAEATRLLLADEPAGDWRRCLDLLAVFAVVFGTLGALVFDFLVEE